MQQHQQGDTISIRTLLCSIKRPDKGQNGSYNLEMLCHRSISFELHSKFAAKHRTTL
jgi:hypothetical protein